MLHFFILLKHVRTKMTIYLGWNRICNILELESQICSCLEVREWRLFQQYACTAYVCHGMIFIRTCVFYWLDFLLSLQYCWLYKMGWYSGFLLVHVIWEFTSNLFLFRTVLFFSWIFIVFLWEFLKCELWWFFTLLKWGDLLIGRGIKSFSNVITTC